jgi:hypothetical protein
VVYGQFLQWQSFSDMADWYWKCFKIAMKNDAQEVGEHPRDHRSRITSVDVKLAELDARIEKNKAELERKSAKLESRIAQLLRRTQSGDE